MKCFFLLIPKKPQPAVSFRYTQNLIETCEGFMSWPEEPQASAAPQAGVSELWGIVVVFASCWGGKLLLNWMPSPCICGCLLFSHVYTNTTVPRKGKLLCIHHANTVNRFVVGCWRRGIGCRFEQHWIVSRFYFFFPGQKWLHFGFRLLRNHRKCTVEQITAQNSSEELKGNWRECAAHSCLKETGLNNSKL